jgi:capsular polysaccharide biosynthesis protein
MQDEISLREIIEPLWKNKWIIILIVLLTTILTGITNYFVIKPTYQVNTTLTVNNLIDKDQQVNKDLNIFVEQMKNSYVVDRIAQKLNSDPESINVIKDGLSIEVVKGSNLIKIKVVGVNPAKITTVANIVSKELASLIESSTRLDMVVIYKKRLSDVEDLLKGSLSEVEEANKQLQSIPEKIVTQKVLADDAYLQSIVSEISNTSNKKLGAIELKNEEINPVYISVKSKLADASINTSKLQALKKNLEEMITKNQEVVKSLQTATNQQNDKNQGLIESLSQFNAVVINPALEPKAPIGPRTKMNTAIAGVFGVAIGLLFVLVREYWKKSQKTSMKEKNLSL